MTYPYSNNISSMTPFDIHNDHENLSETEFLKNAIATHTKYGSTNCNLGSQNFRFITHYVEPTDTLQGLALKYGSKIENIKKFNKLYSDDNNHLRSRFSIVVPIETKTKIQFDSDLSSSQSSQSSLDPGSKSFVTSPDQNKHILTGNTSVGSSLPRNLKLETMNSHSLENVPNSDNQRKKEFTSKSISFSDTNYLSKEQQNNESVADFLIRIDSSIARTKNQIENYSKRLSSNSIENELNKINQTRKFNTPRLSSEKNLLSSTSASSRNIFDQDTIVVTRNKKIKSSLKRLEKSQEEIFEL